MPTTSTFWGQLHIHEMAVNTTDIAVVCFFAVALVVIFLRWPPWLLRQVLHCVEDALPVLSGDIQQNGLILPTRALHVLGSERICRYALLGLYIFANTFFICAADRSSQVSRRSAVASTVNLVPSLLSGRTRILIESLNLSSQQQFFAHKWFARISFLEAIVHSVLVLKTGMPRTAQATCGLVASANFPRAIAVRR